MVDTVPDTVGGNPVLSIDSQVFGVLDVAGDPAQTGKAVRADARKTTFVSFSGIDGARQLAAELCQTADRALAPFGSRADRLRELSAFVAARRV